MEMSLPKDKAELLTLIKQEWDALFAVIEHLTPEQMVTPDVGGWSPKDNLAHIQAWEGAMLNSYLRGKPFFLAMGLDQAHLDTLDEEGINAVIFERNKGRSPGDVLAGAKATHSAVLDELAGMPFDDLMRPMRPDDPEKRPLILWVIGNTSDHFAEHRRNIEAGH